MSYLGSLVFLISIIASLAGSHPSTGSAACELSALLNEGSTWMQYIMCISVSVVSYLLLLHPTSYWTLLLEKQWWMVVAAPCLLAVGLTTLQATHHGAVYVGGFCWNVSTYIFYADI